MKKTLLALATLAILTTGSVMAQRGYDPGYGPGYNDRYPSQVNPNSDNRFDEYRIDRLDAIVGLTRRQERELRRIEERYDRIGLMPGNNRLSAREFQRLQWQKQQDVMSVLTPIQRDRLYAFQQNNRNYRNGYPNRGGYGGGYGGYGRRG